MKSGKKKLRKLMKVSRNGIARIRLRGNKDRGKYFNMILQGLNYFCTHTSLHGLRYVVDPELHVIGRFLWFVVFVISSTIASNVIYSLAHRFQAAPTSIGIESMHYETSNLPFPSVTLCPNDRVDWSRALELEPRIFSNVTDEASVETFRKILGKLSVMSFGDFDELDFLKKQNLKNNYYRTGINITQVLHEVMPRCDQLLSTCWWRNANRNCCEIFEVQKTEYGFCYSFNSEVAQTAPANLTESRPRRASGYGDWSGVKVTIHLGNISKPPNSGKGNAGM
ncbi:pickpocket protein 19-like [Temnothorax longispinosus]|uniref:pickpocket protein 19-like n=1 Tax=Temnothorax longispinosus TaxID=300112 RepID=UPI003A9A1AD0